MQVRGRLILLAFALLIAAPDGIASSAFGQGKTAAGDSLPKHPIPYRDLEKRSAKPKPKSAVKPPAAANAVATPGGAVPALAPKPSAPAGAPAANPLKPAPPALSKPTPATIAPVNARPAPLVARPAAPSAPPPLAPPPLALPPSAPPARGQPVAAADLDAFVDGQVSRAMTTDHIAGVAVAVVQNGQLLMEKGYGVAATAPARRIDPRSTLVRLGSASQIFTWIAALKAVEEGRLKLDRPANDYLPDDLKLPDEGFDHPILVGHLMSHAAGFEDRRLGRRYQRDAGRLKPLDEALRRLRPRRVRAAGLISVPSDYGVALAGSMVARAEGRPFDPLIETAILKPLALGHTTFREPYPAGPALPDPMPAPLAQALSDGFHWTGRGFEPEPFAFGQSLAPALSASTTADDMARLMIALLNNGRLGQTALYGPSIAALLAAPLQAPAPGLPGWAHGLAEMTLPNGARALYDEGASPTFHSNLFLVPSLGLGVFVTANTDTGAALADGLPKAIVSHISATPSSLWNASPHAEQSGVYLSAERASHGLEAFADRLNLTSTLSIDEHGDLVVQDQGGVRSFAPTGRAGRFMGPDGSALYIPEGGAKPPIYILGSGQGAAERVGGVHSLGVLTFWAAATGLTILATFAGLFIRDRGDDRQTRPQIIASVTQTAACASWCLAFVAFGLFVRGGASLAVLTFDWPNRWLVTASWCALIAGLLSLAMLAQLRGAYRDERRIHGWSAWRKLRYTLTVAIFLVFTAVLAAWGALEPWSS